MSTRKRQPAIRRAQHGCFFCELLESKSRPFLVENDFFYAVEDHYPVNDKHSLIVSKRHTVTLAELTKPELIAFAAILRELQRLIRRNTKAEGFNIGVNEGVAAGQTIEHLHVHLIPRYSGDVENPRGGIRNLKPSLVHY